MSRKFQVIVFLLLLAAAAVAWGCVAFQRDLSTSEQRLSGASKIIETKSGPIEYAEAGQGPVVLVVHGAGGGFDQGMDLAGSLAQHGFRVIAVSRFGYLQTPMPADASVTAQARAHADLLAALGINKAAIFGVSAGGPSALQFAYDYPEQCTALVMMVPLAYRPTEAGTPAARVPSATEKILLGIVGSDLGFWLATKLAPDLVTGTVLGTPPELVANASAEEQEAIRLFMNRILPISGRTTGIMHDATVFDSLKPLDLGRITTPSLLITARDDLYHTFAGTKFTAKGIPGARFIGYETGGHMLVGHQREVELEILAFLKAAADM